MTPLPGDFCCVSAGGFAGPVVGAAQRFLLVGGIYSEYEHAFIFTGLGGDRAVIQAEPTGTAYDPLRPHAKMLWSTGAFRLTSEQRTAIVAAATSYLGVDYSFADYLAIGLHRWHIPVPHLQAYIASTRHMICSQLVDQCYLEAGVHLFEDGRWPGFVSPSDLARLIDDPLMP